MLCVGLVHSVSCIVVSVWRPCFVRVLSTVCRVMLCLSGDHASCGSCQQCVMYLLCLSGDHASCGSCRQCVLYLLCLSGDHALCGCCRQCVMYCCVCLVTILRAGIVHSVSCNVVSVWRPCFVWVLSTVYHVLLCLSGDHASCGSCRQCVV